MPADGPGQTLGFRSLARSLPTPLTTISGLSCPYFIIFGSYLAGCLENGGVWVFKEKGWDTGKGKKVRERFRDS